MRPLLIAWSHPCIILLWPELTFDLSDLKALISKCGGYWYSTLGCNSVPYKSKFKVHALLYRHSNIIDTVLV